MFFVKISTMAKQQSDSIPVIRAASAGILVFLLLVLVDQLSVHLGLTGVQRLGDDVLGAMIVAGIAFVDERGRIKSLSHRLHIISLMNHHVRNSLQAIKFAQHVEHHARLVDDAVTRIEWALREILPAEITGKEEEQFPKIGKQSA